MKQPKIFSYQSMGTTWKISIWDEINEKIFHDIRVEIMQKSQEFDRTYSRFIKTSFVWELTKKTGVVEVPEDFMNMLKLYNQFYEPSDKKLNPLIGFTISDLGYDADYSLTPQQTIRSTPDVNTAVKILDNSHIFLSESVLFDFGALGKGYFVDVIAHFLKQKNVQRFLVDGSGDISYVGNDESIRVGLEHPEDPSKVIGVVEMKQGTMCSSGTNRRKWGEFSHIIDPYSRTSQHTIISTWVMAKSAAVSDALATALFLSPPESFSFVPFEYCILNSDYKIKRSAGFLAELF